MKTHINKLCVYILLVISIVTPDSLSAKRFEFDPPLDNEIWWKRNGIEHSYPKEFNNKGQYGWAFGTAWMRRHRSMPWKPDPTVLLVSTILQSDDKQCELYYPAKPDDVGSYGKDSITYSLFPVYYTKPSLAHRDFILRYLPEFKGQDDFRFENYVTAIGGAMPHDYFNADSVFFWHFPIKPTRQEGEKYTECTFMYIWNKERLAGLVFAWFFTDEGKKNKWQYIEKLKKCVWYKEMPQNGN